MGAWPGKYVIGLTGNIATGKSVVRRMLEHLGAYGIDADALAHRVIAKDAPGYQPVIQTFGNWILDADGQINRSRLGRIVFADADALAKLEAIIHPLVRQAVQLLARRASQKVIVIEAIKLLEGELRNACDSIWVAHVNPEVQLARLVLKRKLSEKEAWQRINAQAPQKDKLAAANVIIDNSRTFEETWRQVQDAWQTLVHTQVVEPEVEISIAEGQLAVQKARPRQADDIAAFISRASGGQKQMSREDVMAAFGDKAYLLLMRGNTISGLVGWQVENLVARVDDVYIDEQVPLAQAAQALLGEVSRASRELQCEVALLFLTPKLAQDETVWNAAGFVQRTIEALAIRAWQEAARESMPEGALLFFNQLRKDRVLRPV
jgi:dephospho-CoA kinase